MKTPKRKAILLCRFEREREREIRPFISTPRPCISRLSFRIVAFRNRARVGAPPGAYVPILSGDLRANWPTSDGGVPWVNRPASYGTIQFNFENKQAPPLRRSPELSIIRPRGRYLRKHPTLLRCSLLTRVA